MSSPIFAGGDAGTEPTVSVVIPTLDNAALLSECLLSLRGLEYPRDRLQVVVVDNGSATETQASIRGRFPEVQYIRLESNHGFAEACNRGAAHATGDYVAFLNDDATAEPGWMRGLLAALRAGGDGAVCAGSYIVSRDGEEIEFSGSSANLFGVGRPRPVWGWPDAPSPPSEGSPMLFASGGAMLVDRAVFLDVGGFDEGFFAYFEDVDFGWRLWVLGYKVVYAPASVARHLGGATGGRSAAHRRYALWECNSLATVLKNYESGNMERILSTALLLLYKRAVLSAGPAFDPMQYRLGAGADTNKANIERLPKVSVAHLAAVDRFNARLPHFMQERRRIQARRQRPDAEILPLLGRAFEPQFAGAEYAQASRALAHAMGLYGITADGSPPRVLVLTAEKSWSDAERLAATLAPDAQVAVALLAPGAGASDQSLEGGVARHRLAPDDPALAALARQADVIVTFVAETPALEGTTAAVAFVGEPAGAARQGALSADSADDPQLVAFCLGRGAADQRGATGQKGDL